MSEAAATRTKHAPARAAFANRASADLASERQASSLEMWLSALQQRAGNRAVAQIVHHVASSGRLQRCSCSSGGGGKCEKCQDEEHQQLRRAPNGSAGVQVGDPAPAIVGEVLASPGHALDAGTRQSMEAHFGHDLSGVRIHTGPRAAESAQAVSARAYTVGQHIVFNGGGYAPGTDAGRRLLAHELAHTIQQRNAASSIQSLRIDGGAESTIAEGEAEAAARSFATIAPARVSESMPRALRRQSIPGQTDPNHKSGGCGVCLRDYPKGHALAGIAVHTIIQAAAFQRYPWLLTNEIFNPGSDKKGSSIGEMVNKGASLEDIGATLAKEIAMKAVKGADKPDLFDSVAEEPGGAKMIQIGEIKPDSESGREAGEKQMKRYMRNLKKRKEYKNAAIGYFERPLPSGLPFKGDFSSPKGCPQQKINVRYWKEGIHLYSCSPLFAELRRNYPECRKCKYDEENEKKKKLKKKGPKLGFGAAIGGSATADAVAGVGFAVNPSGKVILSAGAGVSYDAHGNVIGAAGISVTGSSTTNIAGAAGAAGGMRNDTTAGGAAAVGGGNDNSMLGGGVVAAVTGRGNETIVLGGAAKGEGENVSSAVTGVKTSGEGKNANVVAAKTTSTDAKADGGEGVVVGDQPAKAPPGSEGEGATGGRKAAEGTGSGEGEQRNAAERATGENKPESKGDASDAVKNSPEFKEAQKQAQQLEKLIAGATPAQRELLAGLVKQYRTGSMPIPDTAWMEKWLQTTKAIKPEHVSKLLKLEWETPLDVPPDQNKAMIDMVLAGKTPPQGPGSTEAETPAEDADKAAAGGISKMFASMGLTEDDVKKQLLELIRNYNYDRVRTAAFGLKYDKEAGGDQVRPFFFIAHGVKCASYVNARVEGKGKDATLVIFDSSFVVAEDGRTFPSPFVGYRSSVNVLE